MEWNERATMITDCPLCGSSLEQPELQNGHFLEYACPGCGLKWQSCVDPRMQTYPQAAQAWMQRLNQD